MTLRLTMLNTESVRAPITSQSPVSDSLVYFRCYHGAAQLYLRHDQRKWMAYPHERCVYASDLVVPRLTGMMQEPIGKAARQSSSVISLTCPCPSCTGR